MPRVVGKLSMDQDYPEGNVPKTFNGKSGVAKKLDYKSQLRIELHKKDRGRIVYADLFLKTIYQFLFPKVIRHSSSSPITKYHLKRFYLFPQVRAEVK